MWISFLSLGKGLFWGTKEKPTHAFHPLPVPETTPARSADDEDYGASVRPRISPHNHPHLVHWGTSGVGQ